jgi:hypothetical protein
MTPPLIWKLALGLALGGAIFLSIFVRAPRHVYPRADLRGMLLGALALYSVGFVASLNHHEAVAAIVDAGGITVSALAAWLSRGIDPRRPGTDPDEDPSETPPPGGGDDHPLLDWAAFERDFRTYARHHERRPTPTR